MVARGLEVDDEQVAELAAQASAILRSRLREGGERMPPFPHLEGDEVEALIGHLEELAGVPPTRRSGMLVRQSAARVGEHVVRGTCHVCHDAAGPGGGHMAMMRGVIPSLASLPEQLFAQRRAAPGQLRLGGDEEDLVEFLPRP